MARFFLLPSLFFLIAAVYAAPASDYPMRPSTDAAVDDMPANDQPTSYGPVAAPAVAAAPSTAYPMVPPSPSAASLPQSSLPDSEEDLDTPPAPVFKPASTTAYPSSAPAPEVASIPRRVPVPQPVSVKMVRPSSVKPTLTRIESSPEPYVAPCDDDAPSSGALPDSLDLPEAASTQPPIVIVLQQPCDCEPESDAAPADAPYDYAPSLANRIKSVRPSSFGAYPSATPTVRSGSTTPRRPSVARSYAPSSSSSEEDCDDESSSSSSGSYGSPRSTSSRYGSHRSSLSGRRTSMMPRRPHSDRYARSDRYGSPSSSSRRHHHSSPSSSSGSRRSNARSTVRPLSRMMGGASASEEDISEDGLDESAPSLDDFMVDDSEEDRSESDHMLVRRQDDGNEEDIDEEGDEDIIPEEVEDVSDVVEAEEEDEAEPDMMEEALSLFEEDDTEEDDTEEDLEEEDEDSE